MKNLGELIQNKIKSKISWEENRLKNEKNQMDRKIKTLGIWAERFEWVKKTLFENPDFREYFVSSGKEDSFGEEYDYQGNLSLFSKSSDLNDYIFIIDLKMKNVWDEEVLLEMSVIKNNGDSNFKKTKHLFEPKNNEGYQELDEFEELVLDQISEFISDQILKKDQEYQSMKTIGP